MLFFDLPAASIVILVFSNISFASADDAIAIQLHSDVYGVEVIPFILTVIFLKVREYFHIAIPLSVNVKVCFLPSIIKLCLRLIPSVVALLNKMIVSPSLLAAYASSNVSYFVSLICAT